MAEARIKGCAWPVKTATDYSPTAIYEPGDVVKVGQYAHIPRVGGGFLMWITAIMRHGHAPTLTGGATPTYIDFLPSQGVGYIGVSSQRPYFGLGGHNPPSAASVIAAAWAAISDATAGWNISKASLQVSSQWAAGGSLPDNNQATGVWTGSDKYFTCRLPIARSTAHSNVGVNTDYTAHPLSPDYWFEMPAAYDPDTYGGTARTDCQAENPEEATFCGRCGRPI